MRLQEHIIRLSLVRRRSCQTSSKHDIVPKLNWALRNLHLFPLNINKVDLALIICIPGIGVNSAKKIVAGRKFNKLSRDLCLKLIIESA